MTDPAGSKYSSIEGAIYLTVGKNVNKFINSLESFGFFKENFSITIRYIGLKFSEITRIVMLFKYSEIFFYQLIQIMIRIQSINNINRGI